MEKVNSSVYQINLDFLQIQFHNLYIQLKGKE